MLGQIPKVSLGRQIATRSFVHESWHRPAHRALVRAASSQQSLCRYPGTAVTFKGTYTHATSKRKLVKQQARDQQVVAMHAASSGTNGASSSQAREAPAEPATTSASMQQGKISSQSVFQDSLIDCQVSLPGTMASMRLCPLYSVCLEAPSGAWGLLLLWPCGSALSQCTFEWPWPWTKGGCLTLNLLHRRCTAGYRQRLGSGVQQPGSRCVQHSHCGGSAPGAEGHAELPPGAAAAEGRP